MHQLIEPEYYKHLAFSPVPITDWIPFLIACIGLFFILVPLVSIGAFLFRLSPIFTTTLNAYCRSRIAWAYGCLFAMALCLGDLCFITFGNRLPSMLTAGPHYFLIVLLTSGVIIHKRYVRKKLSKLQEYSK